MMTLSMGIWDGTQVSGWANVSTFGNVRYSQGISECGVSGVATAQLSFDIPTSMVPYPYDAGTAVRFSGTGDKVFWVNQRNVGRFVTSFTCLDSVALLDTPIDCTLGRYTGQDDKRNYYLSGTGVVTQVSKAGRGLSLTGLELPTSYGFPMETVQGKTLMQLLTETSEMMGGFYATDYQGNLKFCYANGSNSPPTHQIAQHSFVDTGGTFRYEHALFAGMPDFEHGTGAGTPNFAPLPDTMYPYATDVTSYTTLEVGGALAKYANKAVNFSFIGHTDFREWHVDNAIVSALPVLGDKYSFAQDGYTGAYRLTDCEVRWVGEVMIASMGGGIPSTGELARRSRRQMEIDNKIEEGKAYGNTLLTRYQGTIFKAVEGTQNADS